MTVTFLQLACTSILGFCSSIPFGVSALGSAITFEIGYFILAALHVFSANSNITSVRVLLVFVAFPQCLLEAIYLRKEIDIAFAATWGICKIIGAISGLTLLEVLDSNKQSSHILKRALGAFLIFVFVLLSVLTVHRNRNRNRNQSGKQQNIEKIEHSKSESKEEQEIEMGRKDFGQRMNEFKLMKNSGNDNDADDDGDNENVIKEGVIWDVTSKQRLSVTILFGLSSGFLGGLFGLGGVPLMVFSLLTDINKDVFRSNASASLMCTEMVAIVQLLIIEKHWQNSHIVQYVCAFIFTAIGLYCGNIIAKHVKQSEFQCLILYFLFVGGLILTTKGANETNNLGVLVACMFIGFILGVVWVVGKCKKE